MTSHAAPNPMAQIPMAGTWRPPTLDNAPVHQGYAARPTNLMAILSLMAAASAWVITGPLGTIAAIVLGFIALGQTKARDEDGRELAIFALVTAGVSIVLGSLVLYGVIALFSTF